MEAPRELARRPAHFAQNLAENVRLRVGTTVALTGATPMTTIGEPETQTNNNTRERQARRVQE